MKSFLKLKDINLVTASSNDKNNKNSKSGKKSKNSYVISLDLLPIGNKGKVTRLIADGNKKRRFLDLGLINNTEIEALQKSPAGDPIAYYVRGTVIALRKEEAANIIVEFSNIQK